MAIALSRRRIVLAKNEAVRGTAGTLAGNVDAVPLLREATFTIKPEVVDRPTLRGSLTQYPDIYPGKSTVELKIAVEVHALSDTNWTAAHAAWMRLLRACGFQSFPQGSNIFAYRVSALTTDNGPLRHNEAVAGTALPGGVGNTCFGDMFSHWAGALSTVFINEQDTPVGIGAGTITSSRGSLETVYTIDQRSTVKSYGFTPQSNLNSQDTVTIEIFTDGKKVKAKGCMGEVEFAFNHGDAAVATFTMQGIVQSGQYGDAAMPTDASEDHKVPPTFLGSHLSLSSTSNNPAATDRYGSDTTIKGALNQMRLNSGNNVILQKNSLDPDGVQFALITDRNPGGSFNPTEVQSATEFDFMTRFVNGQVARMRVILGANAHNSVTADKNTFQFVIPGVTFAGLADQDRDGINVWDASFRMGGGDYDTTALGELLGSDNEFTMLHH